MDRAYNDFERLNRFDEACVNFYRRSHLPIVLASDIADKPMEVPWWENRALRLTTSRGAQKF